MKDVNIRYCRECRFSQHRSIKNLKNAFLENEEKISTVSSSTDRSILEDYAHKNIIKKPTHLISLSRMATEMSKEWKNGRRLTVAFMGGNKLVKERIIRHAKIWMEHANIELVFGAKLSAANIRVAFDMKDGSWSFIGNDILSIPTNEATMNFGWLTPTLDDEEYSRVVLHEFGHSLGCIHEHERPDNGIPWDKQKVYAYYAEKDGWSKEEVDEQVFSKYDKDLIRSNKLDKKSIMMYPVPDELTIGKYQIGWNRSLSPADKKFISMLYPKK
jgi:hypothetical protein